MQKLNSKVFWECRETNIKPICFRNLRKFLNFANMRQGAATGAKRKFCGTVFANIEI